MQPDRDPSRIWLVLLVDERAPKILDADLPHTVTWSSIWVKRPDAKIRFDLSGGPSGTRLRWTVFVDEPLPDDSLIGHIRKRMNELINANLRYSYGQ